MNDDVDELDRLGLHWTDVVGEFGQMQLQNRVLLTLLASKALFAYQRGEEVSERDRNVLLETRNLLDQIGIGALAGYTPREEEYQHTDAESARFCGYAFQTWRGLEDVPQNDAEFLVRLARYHAALDAVLDSPGKKRVARNHQQTPGVEELGRFFNGYRVTLSAKLNALDYLTSRLECY